MWPKNINPTAGDSSRIKRSGITAVLVVCFLAPSLRAQSRPTSGGDDHIEVGAFVDYFNLSHPSPHINFVGLGGRAAFNVRNNVQIEAEMAYDFKRNFTTTFTHGGSTQLVNTDLRTLHALFGPKSETSGGHARLFGTFKAGLVNVSVSNQNASAGFQNALSDVTTGNTAAAIYPAWGLRDSLGPSDCVWRPGTRFTSRTAPTTTSG